MGDLDVRALFAQSEETFEDAQKRTEEENSSFSKANYFTMPDDGKYIVRILPLAPVVDNNGNIVPTRKSYEYPNKEIFLKLRRPDAKTRKDSEFSIPVCHTKYVGYDVDLIDTYVKTVQSKYADNEDLVKKVGGNSFSGGLKYDSRRCAYVYDLDNKKKGLQILKLSYSQYKDLEERKMELWNKLNKKSGSVVACPISSIQNAYPVEIIRKKNGPKTEYSFNIDTISGVEELTEEEMKALLDAPRINDVIYRYSRYHMEATIQFLKQYDEDNDIDIMSTKEMKDAIEKLSLDIPKDDTSHFSFDKKENKPSQESNESPENILDSFWDRYDEITKSGASDKSDEGLKLRNDIREFIDDNELEVRVTRNKSNEDLLQDIEDAIENKSSKKAEERVAKRDVEEEEKEEEPESPEEPEEEPVTAPRRRTRAVEPDDREKEPSPIEEPEEGEEEPKAPASYHRPSRKAR